MEIPKLSAKDLFKTGKLKEAVALATEGVKAAPAEVERRWLLCELLCFAGDFQRADVQMETIQQQAPQGAPGISLFRQLIRAEQARQEFYTAGRVPEFLEA